MRVTTLPAASSLAAGPGTALLRLRSRWAAPRRAAGVRVVARSVSFKISRKLQFGDSVAVAGDCSQLGAWDASKGLKLSWTEGNVWSGQACTVRSFGSCI